MCSFCSQVVLMNALFGMLVERMAQFEKHVVADKQASAAFRGLLMRQFFNTAIIVVLINADLGSLFEALGLSDPTKSLVLGTSSLWEVGIGWYDPTRPECCTCEAAVPHATFSLFTGTRVAPFCFFRVLRLCRYSSVGTPILMSAAFSVFSFQVFPLCRCGFRGCRRCCAKYCCKVGSGGPREAWRSWVLAV